MKFDVVIIGGGLSGSAAGVELVRAGLRCAMVSGGGSTHKTSREEFVSLGGTLFPGDRVLGGVFDKTGSRLLSVDTRNLKGMRLEADRFILATGKFFSRGLVSTMDRIYEPVFGCDVVYDPDRDNWVSPDFFAPQPFESFGLRVDGECHPSVGGRVIKNLFAAGEILSGDVDIVGSAMEVVKLIVR